MSDDELTRTQQQQAQSFFKVMVKKGMNVPEMANVTKHMGEMLLEYANNQLDGARKEYTEDTRVSEAEFNLRMGMH